MNHSILSSLHNEWKSRGWDISALQAFRMETPAGNVGDASGGTGQAGGDQSGQQQQGQGSEPPNDGSEYSLASGFLDRVTDPNHKTILEPYVKQWDAGVTRRFQELHSQLSPYQELGDLEYLQQAASIAQMMEDNPWAVYGTLHQALMSGEFGPQPDGQQQQQQAQIPQQEQGLPGPEEMPSWAQEMQQQNQQLQQALLALGNHVIGQQQTSQQQEQAQQLDDHLSALHEEFGDFDDEYVMTKVLGGMSWEDAVNSFSSLVTQRATGQLQRGAGIPALLGAGGGSGVASDPSSVKDLSRDQTRQLVIQQLAQAKSQQG